MNLSGESLGGVAVVPELAEPPVLGDQSHPRVAVGLGCGGGGAGVIGNGLALLGQELLESGEGVRAQRRRVVVIGGEFGVVVERVRVCRSLEFVRHFFVSEMVAGGAGDGDGLGKKAYQAVFVMQSKLNLTNNSVSSSVV